MLSSTGTAVNDQMATIVQNNWRQLLVAGKYGVEYSLASASDGACPRGRGVHDENGVLSTQIFHFNHRGSCTFTAHTATTNT